MLYTKTWTKDGAIDLKCIRQRGGRLVLATGVFDLLHPGHVATLQQARKLGDFLLVGLNSDRSVRQLKGPQRPIVTEQGRMAVVVALACVDAVCLFDDVTVAALLREVRPEVWVKGGDYTLETLVAAERVAAEAVGTQIVLLPRVAGWSTTQLVQAAATAVASPEAALT